MSETEATRRVEHAAPRLLITYAVFSYNQERFIREAIECALAQDYSPLEIIISDDCSTDRTFEVIRESTAGYAGPHTLVINRNPKNLGIARHVNWVMTKASGSLIVMAGGDDLSVPSRASVIASAWLRDGQAKAVYSEFSCIDEIGNPVATPRKLSFEFREVPDLQKRLMGFLTENINRPPGCTQAISAELFRIFGPLNENCFAEDKAFAFRALLTGNLLNLSECLVKYRLHENNLSGSHLPQHIRRGIGRMGSETRFSHRRSWRITRNQQQVSDLSKAKELGLIDDSVAKPASTYLQKIIGVDESLMCWWSRSWWERLAALPKIMLHRPKFTKWALLRMLPRRLFEYLRP